MNRPEGEEDLDYWIMRPGLCGPIGASSSFRLSDEVFPFRVIGLHRNLRLHRISRELVDHNQQFQESRVS